MIEFIQMVMITLSVYFAYRVGVMLDQIRMFKVLDKALDRIEEIRENLLSIA